ncbi:carbohydrate ABC transporter permease [Virgibacillus siamensis]|uniref:carbohydrate ABC transporter permease n=1 Tax=Virgibacillus siamensis TaxID=480071 RepID=UPI000984C711|nr:sugar ABC transporter permease [Virgibacillus siamensis]
MAEKEKKARKSKLKRSEKKAAYWLVAPSIILILIIAIYPVLQSFYFSLFDLKLNDPTKSSVHLNYSVNIEEYLNYYPFLAGDLETEIQQTDGAAKEKLAGIHENLLELDSKIRDDAGDVYGKVNKMLNNFKTPPSDLSMVEISDDTAKKFKGTIQEVNEDLKELDEKGVLSNGKELTGLASGMTGVIIEPNFIGFDHYADLLQNGRMWASLGNTFVFTIISVFFEFVLGLAVALLVNKAFFGRGLIRATVLIPWAIPTAVSAMMWKFLYDGQNGVIAKFFTDIGLVDSMGSLLSTEIGGMFSVILSDVWKTTPYIALLLLGGLQVIPKTLYEAASIDGAGKWKQFITITLPMLKLSILVALLFRTLDAFRVFDLIYVLTGGGPANATETISILAYQVMFSQLQFGAGSAIAVIVFICVAIISMIFVKLLGSDLLPEGSKK